MKRVIFHMDMDAFYASIEIRDNPELRGLPLLIGGGERRGVVATASYEARKFGAGSAMPMAKALKLCPDAVVLRPNMAHYAAVSREIMAVLDRYSPLVEPLSLDEAFLDMTGTERLLGPPLETAQRLKDEVWQAVELRCSVGVAPNKFLAKLASDLDKPDGLTHIPAERAREILAPLPIRKIWGVGPKSAAKLEGLGLTTIGHIARADPVWLRRLLGDSYATHLQRLARGEDDRPVHPDRERKSIGSEVTLDQDLRGRAAVEAELRRQCEEVARDLRRKEMLARSVRVKVRFTETFQLATRQGPLPAAVQDSRTLFETGRVLLDTLDLDAPIRLVGAAAFDLTDADSPGQLGLFGAEEQEERTRLESTLDEIRSRFGDKIRRGE